MPLYGGALGSVRPLCAWFGCPRQAQVQVQYQSGSIEYSLGLELGPRGGLVILCDRHARELREALEPERTALVARLG